MMLGKVLVAPQGAYKKCIFPDATKSLIPHRKWVLNEELQRWPSSVFLFLSVYHDFENVRKTEDLKGVDLKMFTPVFPTGYIAQSLSELFL